MLFLYLCFLFFSLIHGEEFVNLTTEIYEDSLGRYYSNFRHPNAYMIMNPTEFKVITGKAVISFVTKMYKIYLTFYKYIQVRKVNNLKEGPPYSDGYGGITTFAIFRGKEKGKTWCDSIATAKYYLRISDLAVRYWSANQQTVDQNSYISSQCLDVDAAYETKDDGAIQGAMVEQAKKTDEAAEKPVAARIFFMSENGQRFEGLAQVGSPGVAVGKDSYWIYIVATVSNPESGYPRTISFIHEFGHTHGWHHAHRFLDEKVSLLLEWKSPDGYDDGGNYMGRSATYNCPTGPLGYYWNTVHGKGEPFYFQRLAQGSNRYRIYAWDHPYSRYVLGPTNYTREPDEIVDGIIWRNNLLSLIIPITKDIISKRQDGEEATVMIEYRRYGQYFNQDKVRGIRVTNGPSKLDGYDNKKMNHIGISFDNFLNWGDHDIPIGAAWIPRSVDAGTFSLKITKIHQVPIVNLDAQIIETKKREYDEAEYVEIETEYWPGRRYTQPTQLSKLMSYTYSPNFFNCKTDGDQNAVTCSRIGDYGGWIYMNEGPTLKNGPRWYDRDRKNTYGRYGIRYNSREGFDMPVVNCYGDLKPRCISFEMQRFDSPDRGEIFIEQVATVTKSLVSSPNVTESFESIVFASSNVDIPKGETMFVTDLFGNEIPVEASGNSFIAFVPLLETDGMFEGGLVMKDKSGKITYYYPFKLSNPYNQRNRVAFNDIGIGNEFDVTAAAVPEYTNGGMIKSRIINANEWFIYVITDLDYHEFIYFDFKNELPFNLRMTIESDNGAYTIDLSALGGLKDISYKLTQRRMNALSGGIGDTYRFKFSATVNLLNIRPITKVGNNYNLGDYNGGDHTVTVDKYQYHIVGKSFKGEYKFSPVSTSINGVGVTFNGINDAKRFTVKPNQSSSSSSSSVIVGFSITAVVILLIVICYCYIKRKKSAPATRSMPPSAGRGVPGRSPASGYAGYAARGRR